MAVSNADGEALATCLREIATGAEAPVDALEPALRAILERTAAAAGALCLFDQRHEFLRLAAEVGLSDEGCRRLRIVRRGDVAGWDMPLHGLLNRRAYLIESAAQNRYVPPLVDASPVRAIACLPLYVGVMPAGSLVLVAVGTRTIAERDIRTLEPALRELGRMIEAVRRRTDAPNVASTAAEPGSEPAPPARPRLDAELAGRRHGAQTDPRVDELTTEIDRLRARLAEAEAGAAHEHRVREELEAALERGASSDQLEIRQAIESGRRADAARAALAAENERLTGEVERLRSGAPRGEDRAAALAAEIDRLRARLAEAEAGAAHEHRVREQLEVALERGASSGQNDLREALDAARRAEAARAALAAENERLRVALERLRDGVPRDAAQATELALEVDRLRARLAEAEAGAAHEHRAREELEAAMERGASHGQHDVRQALETARRAEDERAAALAENARLTAELEWARHEVERIEPLAAALATARDSEASLGAELESARAKRAALDGEIAERQTAWAAEHRAEIERLEHRLAESDASAARERHLRERLEAANAHDVSERSDDVRRALEASRLAEEARDGALAAQATARAELARAASERDEVHAALGRLRDELDQAHADRGSLGAERDRLLDELAAAGRRAAESARRVTEHEAELGRIRSEHARETAAAAALGAEAARLGAALAAAEVERDRATADVQGAAAARARLEESLAATLEGGRAREQAFAKQLAEAEEEIERREAARVSEAAAASARVGALTAEADGLRSAVSTLEADRARLAAEAEGASAARARLEEALARGLEEARAREQTVASLVEERDREIARLEGERAAEAAAATTRIEALSVESEALRRTVAGLETERDRLSAEGEGGAAARARLEETLTRTIEEARAREQALRVRIDEREGEIARPAVAAEVTGEPAGVAPNVAETASSASATPGRSAEAADGSLVVLDVDRSWDRIASGARAFEVVAPDGMAGRSVARIRPDHIVANLGAPRVLDTLVALRAEGCTSGFWGCVADATADRALLLGRIEPATRPLDPDAVLASLRLRARKGTRVVTIGDDVDAFVSLRQAFARAGMSVSMAWNAKQAAELIPMVRPAVVVLELDLPSGDVQGILGEIAALDPLPTTVLMPATSERGRRLAADLAHQAVLIPIAEVLARLTPVAPSA